MRPDTRRFNKRTVTSASEDISLPQAVTHAHGKPGRGELGRGYGGPLAGHGGQDVAGETADGTAGGHV